jgi:uncharacterized membrane protein HdeD (DUF308 family)
MFIHNPQKDVSLEEESAVVSRRLSRRWKLLQILGGALIALAGVIDWLHFSDPTVPATFGFFLMLGIIVFVSGFVMRRGDTAGFTGK